MNIRRWTVASLFCIAVFAALAGFKVMEIKAAIAFGESFPEPSETVEMSMAKIVLHQDTIQVLGEAVATQSITLRNELPGSIVTVNFQSGEQVEKDQLLLQLDVSQEQANLRASIARVNLAKSVYKRANNLFKSKAVSQEQLDTAIADLAALEAEVEALNSSIRKKTIRAPFAGFASIHQFEVGQYLADNSLITTLVGSSDTVWIDFNVPQFYPPLTRQLDLSIERIGRNSGSNSITTGKLVAQDQTINEESRSRFYRAEVNTQAFPVSPLAAVSVIVPIGPKKPVIAVAATSIQQDNLGQYVYLLVPNSESDGYRAKRATVNVLTKKNGLALIDVGLNENDQVAAAGSFKLHEGMLVYVGNRRTPSKDTTAHHETIDNETAGAM